MPIEIVRRIAGAAGIAEKYYNAAKSDIKSGMRESPAVSPPMNEDAVRVIPV